MSSIIGICSDLYAKVGNSLDLNKAIETTKNKSSKNQSGFLTPWHLNGNVDN